MLISPPFLPSRGLSQSEHNWLEVAMCCGQPGDGAFPLSYQLGWHGGVHLTAPATETGSATEHVRAIADGTVIFVRKPTPRVDDPAHPLNYRGWTDDGCVVLRHRTSIGQGEHAESVEFFSVYMHLAVVQPAIVNGRKVYRKADLGQAGQIYGAVKRKIHFEIVCDDANLRRLTGRAGGPLDTGNDGRTDSVYGALYFLLPAGTQVFGKVPVPHLTTPHYQAPRPRKDAPLPPLEPISTTYVTKDPLIIEIRFAHGEGNLSQRGDMIVTTRQMDGGVITDPLREADAEYNLYATACAIAKAFPSNRSPIQSTVLEMLRFGRTVNIANEAATTETIPNWCRIAYPGGTGWVNLNAAAIRKFSDADLPEWAGWTMIDDAKDGDSRCDSSVIKKWLGQDNDDEITLGEAEAALSTPGVVRKLAKAVCKFPSEWNVATIDARWKWLKTASAKNPLPLTDDDFEQLKTHIQALCIDAAALHNAEWHWHPLEFILHFRKCTWLSLDELSQLLPRQSARSSRNPPPVTWDTVTKRFRPYHVHLNTTMRKFGIVSRDRQIHFLAQTYIETALWGTMKEFGLGKQSRRKDGTLYWSAPAMQYYQPFYGRGAMQLTWPSNYENYGIYRTLPSASPTHVYEDTRMTHTSMHYWADPRDKKGVVVGKPQLWWPRYDPNIIATNPFYACDSAGYYWTSKNTGGGRININRVADQGINTAAVGRVSVLVNGGGYGFGERQGYAVYIERFLGDVVGTTDEKEFSVNYGKKVYDVYVNFTPQRPD